MRIAFAGFRHGHILSLYQQATEHADVQVVAASESHAPTIESLKANASIAITHNNFETMLAEVQADTVAIGDYYGARGAIAIAALKAGKHVIADKPICTSLTELDEIDRLVASKGLKFGCMLDMRANGNYLAARSAIARGDIGEVHTVTFSGQHPLLWGTRAAWYFEEGKHGGTINDIAIHAIDLIPWLTGRTITGPIAARVWNARIKDAPSFQDGAQLMLRLDNNGGVMGDVSYLAPEKCGYGVPQYWRTVVHGANGMIEITLAGVQIANNTDTALRNLPAEPAQPLCVLEAFLADVAGKSAPGQLTTRDVLKASRIALETQALAERTK